MKAKSIISVFIIFIALGGFLYSEAVSGIKVLNIFGNVDCKKSGQTEWADVNKGDLLGINDSVRTGIDSYTELELCPDNKVRLKENSEILIKDLEKESMQADGSVVKLTDFNLIEGDLALKLDKLPKDTLIQVSSPTAVAGARGTAFVVRHDKNGKVTNVGVLESSVSVQSAGEPNKVMNVPVYKKVSVTPWAMATPQVRGTGILSEKILGKPFIEVSTAPVLEVTGTGDTEEKAKDNAYYNLSKKILSISIGPDKRIEDLLNENPSLCQPLYSYIAKGEMVSKKTVNNKTEIVIKLPLAPVGPIIGRELPPLPSVVKPIDMKEYGDKFGPVARATTQRAAQLDGYRKLAEMIHGTVIDSKTTLKDYEIKDDRITTTVEGIVKGAEILDTQYFSDGSITLVMAIRADLVMTEVSKITGDIFGTNYFTSPRVIDIDDFLAL